jgi:hypothetical protein
LAECRGDDDREQGADQLVDCERQRPGVGGELGEGNEQDPEPAPCDRPVDHCGAAARRTRR